MNADKPNHHQNSSPVNMRGPQKYDPPESVVGPAFMELRNRVARARIQTTTGVQVSEEERKISDYGVAERKRVLEHTLFLVFGQWAVYRQLVSRSQSRGLRIAYGIGSFVTSFSFLSSRARRVSQEMFATIATTATTSSLGNEARIVLAELEGPDGPYFRRICNEKGFKEDLASVMAILDSKEGVDPTSDHVHPQLRLRPRLPVPSHSPEELARGSRPRERRDSSVSSSKGVDFRPARVQRGSMPVDTGTANQASNKDLAQIRQELRENRARERKSQETEVAEDLWGKPFDFQEAATRGRVDNLDNSEPENRDFGDEEEQKLPNLTPSQRRAAERRERRLRARMGAGGTERDDKTT